jgi:PmbA protein
VSSQISATQLLDTISGQARAEVWQVRTTQLPLTFRGGSLESMRAVETSGRALRVIQDGRLGFSTSTDLADGPTLVRNALESAQFGDAVPFDWPAQQPLPEVQTFDPAVASLDGGQMIALGQQIVDQIRAYAAGMQIDVSIDKGIEEIELLNSSGLHLADRRTLYRVSIGVTRTRGDDILIVTAAASARRLQDVDERALAAASLERLRWAENLATLASRPMPVVFRGPGTLPLFLPLIMGLDGRQVYLGTSPLGRRLGEAVFDPRFTLTDDGLAAGSGRSAAFDDEGMPTRTRPLVEQGTLCHFMYDLKTAAQVGVESTANGYRAAGFFDRGFHVLPTVTPTNWIVPAGEQSLEDILSGLDEALLVEDVIGLGQGNVLSGEFSNNVGLGFLVRRGEIVGRVKNTMIAGNIYNLLKHQLLALGDQAEWVRGLLHVPAIAVDGVDVISK